MSSKCPSQNDGWSLQAYDKKEIDVHYYTLPLVCIYVHGKNNMAFMLVELTFLASCLNFIQNTFEKEISGVSSQN